MRLDGLLGYSEPFNHWVDPAFLSAPEIHEIHAEWPAVTDKRWVHEKGAITVKSALLFPHRLPPKAYLLASKLYSTLSLEVLSDLLGIELLPDPYFHDGPLSPMVGGGLHEIHPGGFLKVHVDFNKHPIGLERAANLLIYLTTPWDDDWGGHLELHGDTVASIAPRGGTAVLFATNDKSWHGHPTPLNCPKKITRRSLALYYYTEPRAALMRPTTVYRDFQRKKKAE